MTMTLSDRDVLSSSPLFDVGWYLNSYPDVRNAGVDAIQHYINRGWREGRNPGPGFATNGYLETYRDVASADMNPLLHYELHGREEGRQPLPVRQMPKEPIQPYVAPKFNLNPEYLYVRQLVEFSDMWDEAWYLSQYYHDFSSARLHDGFDGGPLDYFLSEGWMYGHRPCEAFRAFNPAKEGVNPLVDLLTKRRFLGYQFVENSWFPEAEVVARYVHGRAARRAFGQHDNKVCYTCITQGYDKLIQPYHIDPDWDYVCFTDDKALIEAEQVGVWEIRPLLSVELNAARNNRWHKINPHIIFPDYSQSLYIDGNVNIISSYIFDLISSTDAPIIMPMHFQRNCLYEEIDILLTKQGLSHEHDRLKAQKKLYVDAGFPRDLRLTENNVIFRRHRLSSVKNLMGHWWSLIADYSHRDQASFMYAYWKSDISGQLTTFPNCRTLYKDFWVVRHLEPIVQSVRNAVKLRLEPAFSENNIPVVMSCNEEFASYLCVFIQSIRDTSNTTRNYDLIILENNITPETKEYITGVIADLGNFSVRFYNMRDCLDALAGLAVHVEGYVPLETYNKIFLAEITRGYGKLLYLDTDLIVNQDLANLFDIDLEGKALGASRNVANISSASEKKVIKGHDLQKYISETLGVRRYDEYFQAGVILLDLSHPRMDYLLTQCIEHMRRVPKPLFFDQCIFNAVFYQDVYFISTAWNHVWYLQRYSKLRGTVPEDIFFDYAQSRNNPAIIHFAGRDKPTAKFDWRLSEYFWHSALRSKAILSLVSDLPPEVGANVAEKAAAVSRMSQPKVRILVHLHLYYIEQLDFMLAALRNTDEFERTVFVTTSLEEDGLEDLLGAALGDVRILRCENVGYDIYPFLKVLKLVDLSEYDYILKLHTKNARPDERGTVFGRDVKGYKWRDDLILALVGSVTTFRANIDKLQGDRTIGCVAHPEYIFSTRDRNEEMSYGLDHWRHRLGLIDGHQYVGGTMFLARAFPFQRFATLDLRDEDFAGDNATGSHRNLAHKLERLFGVAIGNEGLAFAPFANGELSSDRGGLDVAEVD